MELLRIKNEYSDYDLRRVRYFYSCLLYEVSKFIIIGGFFCLFGLLPEYVFSVLFICPLRILSGGLHFRSYLGCLLFSILYFSVSIMPFGNYHPTKGTALFLLPTPIRASRPLPLFNPPFFALIWLSPV